MLRSSALTVALIMCALPVRAVTIPAPTLDTRVIISVRDQKLILITNGAITATYPVSTSKYGLSGVSVTRSTEKHATKFSKSSPRMTRQFLLHGKKLKTSNPMCE